MNLTGVGKKAEALMNKRMNMRLRLSGVGKAEAVRVPKVVTVGRGAVKGRRTRMVPQGVWNQAVAWVNNTLLLSSEMPVEITETWRWLPKKRLLVTLNVEKQTVTVRQDEEEIATIVTQKGNALLKLKTPTQRTANALHFALTWINRASARAPYNIRQIDGEWKLVQESNPPRVRHTFGKAHDTGEWNANAHPEVMVNYAKWE